jgi:hypothetical protein
MQRFSTLVAAGLVAVTAACAAVGPTAQPAAPVAAPDIAALAVVPGATVADQPDRALDWHLAVASLVAPLASSVPLRDDWAAPRQQTSLVVRARPSRVEIVGSHYQYQYLVNGRPQVIRGMGLNTRYTRLLSPGQRALRLDADFQLMQRLGVNTVLGWDEAEFDDTLMALAQKHHLGVVVPFELDQDADYTDPAVRAQATAHVLERVAAFRNYPSLRMWGLGNEVLHKIVHPSWLGRQDPAHERNARAFAAWLVETANAVHALDPDHPVTYRDAEDAFVSWIADAFKQRGGGAPAWFAFGTNGYTYRLHEIVVGWPSKNLDVPLWVSEFAPAGVAPAERTAGLRKMWGYVRERPEEVLGGAVYTWTRNGPEEIDRAMGITDDGAPVGSALIETMGDLFREEASGST